MEFKECYNLNSFHSKPISMKTGKPISIFCRTGRNTIVSGNVVSTKDY